MLHVYESKKDSVSVLKKIGVVVDAIKYSVNDWCYRAT